MTIYPSQYAPIPVGDLENWNTDRTVDPVIMTRGVQYKTSGGWWNNDGQSYSDDAGLMRVSALGVSLSLSGGSFSSSPLSADGSSVSCVQEDASVLRMSAFSDDAAFMRVSAVGGSTVSLSADAIGNRVSAFQTDATNLMVSAKSDDAALMRVSAVGLTTSKLSADADAVSAVQEDAGKLRTSATITNTVTRVSADILGGSISNTTFGATQSGTWAISSLGKEGTSFLGQVSATLKAGTSYIGKVSAAITGGSINNTAFALNAGSSVIGKVSSINSIPEGSNFIGSVSSTIKNPTTRVSADLLGGSIDNTTFGATQTAAGSLRVSAFSDDAAFMRVSAVGDSTVSLSADAIGNRVSAFSNDGGLMRVSAIGSSTVSLSADAVGNRVSSFQTDASALMVSGRSDDAALFRVSAIGVSVDTSPLSADSSSISAIQADAGKLRVSATITNTITRVSSDLLGGSIDNTAFGATQSGTWAISSLGKEGTAFLGSVSARINGDVDVTNTDPANLIVSGSSNTATGFRVSAFSDSAATFRVSALGVTLANSQSLSARNLEGTAFIGNVSATLKAGTASIGLVSATLKEGTSFVGQVSSTLKAGTAYIGKVSSAITGGSIDNTTFGATQSGTWAISALANEGTAHIGQVSATLVDDGTITKYLGRVSALGVTASLDGDATNNRVSAFSDDASFMRVSALGVTTTTTPLSADADVVSAKQFNASNLMVSARSDDAAFFRVNVVSGGGSFANDASSQPVSAKSNDAGLLRTSSYIVADTVGGLTIGRLSNLSSSGNIKATAGSIYGYYAYNTTAIPAYINFTNTSGAINKGTDAVMFKAMIPASAGANVWFGQGIKGFTNGIGAYGTSAIADNATTPCATSAVGINVFYS